MLKLIKLQNNVYEDGMANEFISQTISKLYFRYPICKIHSHQSITCYYNIFGTYMFKNSTRTCYTCAIEYKPLLKLSYKTMYAETDTEMTMNIYPKPPPNYTPCYLICKILIVINQHRVITTFLVHFVSNLRQNILNKNKSVISRF